MAITSIHVGDKVECLFCKGVFKIDEIEFSSDGEYLACPLCNKCADIQYYHMYGTKIDSK